MPKKIFADMCQLWALHVVTKRQFFLHLSNISPSPSIFISHTNNFSFIQVTLSGVPSPYGQGSGLELIYFKRVRLSMSQVVTGPTRPGQRRVKLVADTNVYRSRDVKLDGYT